MKVWAAIAAVCIGIGAFLLIGPAQAQAVTELWRTPFGKPRALTVDSADGSCWMNTSSGLTHVSAAGEVLAQERGRFEGPIAVNPTDGSWWAADARQNRVAHFSAAGDLLWSSGEVTGPTAVAVDPTDGSCWFADNAGYDGSGGYVAGRVTHLSPDGTVLSSTYVHLPRSLAVNPRDGSCWVGRDDGVSHVSLAGEVVWSLDEWNTIYTVAVDTADGSCWAGSCAGATTHYSSSGETLWTRYWYERVGGLSVNPLDGSCWIAFPCPLPGKPTVVHLSRDGTQLWSSDEFGSALCVAVDPADGSCWVGDSATARAVRLATDGTELWAGQGFARASSISVSTADDSCWVADGRGQWMEHLSAAGEETWADRSGAHPADSVSANPSDGSCWSASVAAARVAHLSETAAELWSGQVLTASAPGSFCMLLPSLVATNPTDGSCWVMDYLGGRLLHLSATGDLLWSRTVTSTGPVAINSADGSCWVGTGPSLLHLSATGEELWSGLASPYAYDVVSIAVNPRDGSAWVGCYGAGASGQVTHLAADGGTLSASGWSGNAIAVAVNATDGSCWVASQRSESSIGQLSPEGESLQTIDACCPVGVGVDPDDGSLWVSECASGQVARFAVAQAAHNFYLTANTPSPPVVLSGGATGLSAIPVDTPDHGVASWTWSDGGAGGSFSPSANAATPLYTAPRNFTGADLLIPLTVTAVCNGDPPLTASASVTLTVGTEYALHLSRIGLGFVLVNGVTQRLPWTDHLQPGILVGLIPVPSPGYELDRWTGDASGTGTITLVMDRDYSITAEFALIPGTAFSLPVDYPQQEFAGWSGWATSPGSGWEWGSPVAGGGQPIGDGGAILGTDPGASHSGESIIGYVIGDNYQPGMTPQYLTTAPLDFRGRQSVSLHFWRWLTVEDRVHDTAAVEVNAGSGWQRLWSNPAGTPPIYTLDTAWTEVECPLPEAAGRPNVQVRWQMGGTDAWTSPTEYGGWSLDDISFQCAADRWDMNDASLDTTLLWEEQTDLSAQISNAGESTWDDSFGLQCLSEHTPTGAWGAEFVPISGTVAPSQSYAFSAHVTAPPVSTMSYAVPLEWPFAGRDATLACEWALGQDVRGPLRGEPFGWDMTISRFTDIQPGTDGVWARFYVEELAGAVPEMVRGYGGGIYRPQEAVTRDQLAVYIARATGLEISDGTGATFQDVPADWWAAGAIEACANAGLIAGYPNYSFHPSEPVTRAGMCKFVANGRAYIDPNFTIPETLDVAPFPDVPADHWAARWITACKQAGIVQGYPGGSFQPDGGVNRGQMAAFMWRAFLRDRESVVVLGGPTLSRYAPTVERYAVGSVRSATIGDTLYASVLLDAVRLMGSAQTVRFDLSRIVSEGPLSPVGSFTATLDGAQVSAAWEAALASGNPYLPITTVIPTAGLEPGEYLVVTSINDIELTRQVHLLLTAPTP